MYTLSNNIITIKVASKGAELQSIYNEQSKLEYMWSGDPAYWGKKSPVLFPIVGELKNNKYTYQDAAYSLSRHGFAREMDFEVTEQTESAIKFSLKSTAGTLEKYPFKVIFSVQYTLEKDAVNITYEVNNADNKEMYFSVGGHPAFKVPVIESTTFEEYYLLFDHNENAGRYPLSAEGLIENNSTPLLTNTNKLPLKKDLFANDALVFKELQSKSISIVSNKTEHGLKVTFDGFPYLGIWSTKGADFVCIEPWCGIADTVNTNGKLEDKEGINKLNAGEVFKRTFSIQVF